MYERKTLRLNSSDFHLNWWVWVFVCCYQCCSCEPYQNGSFFVCFVCRNLVKFRSFFILFVSLWSFGSTFSHDDDIILTRLLNNWAQHVLKWFYVLDSRWHWGRTKDLLHSVFTHEKRRKKAQHKCANRSSLK